MWGIFGSVAHPAGRDKSGESESCRNRRVPGPQKPLANRIVWRHKTAMQQQALSAIVAWIRLERAMEKFHLELKKQLGLTGLQLAVLRILAERPQLPLAALRKTLVMHPATLGQSIDELRLKGLCTVRRDAKDKRARLVSITAEGLALLEKAPLAGPVRLRQVDHEPERLDRLTVALEDAMGLFGLEPWAPSRGAERAPSRT
ncbi:winged helix-turn-helix transcriptional regulator [Youhaiella tibetensis]|uniref:Winged helix-turn-helix transcriptional regulator n=2 Tax=Paradevosia tibetensis TaxID=1447062 RepID=A0A5B9DVR0_9HYPH|nr:winged helix-turn-helix transcriptional regulator [Youhaiella tibetensis]